MASITSDPEFAVGDFEHPDGLSIGQPNLDAGAPVGVVDCRVGGNVLGGNDSQRCI